MYVAQQCYHASASEVAADPYTSRTKEVPEDPFIQRRFLLRFGLANKPRSNMLCKWRIPHVQIDYS